MPSIFKFRAVATLLVLLGLGYVALWYTVGFRTQKALTSTLSGWLDQGFAVDHGTVSLSGFPYRLVLDVDDLRVSTRERGLAFASQKLTLVSHLWTPDHWIAQASGAQIILAGGAISLKEDFLQASYRLHAGDKLVVKIDSAGAKDMTLLHPDTVPAPDQWSLLLGKDSSEQEAAGGLYEKRTLEFKFFAQKGNATLDVTGGVSGPGIGDWAVSDLRTWRDEGGLLALDDIVWQTPEFRLSANGDVTLDERFKPLGSATLRGTDWAAIATALRPYSVILNRNMAEETALMMQNGSALVGDAVAFNLPSVISN